jgi:hypothetical protein
MSVGGATLVPVGLHAELVAAEEVLPAFVTSLGEHGLRFDSLAIVANRSTNRVCLQLSLPGEPDPLWIGAEIVRDVDGSLLHEVAVRFLDMADAHWRRLRRWVRERELRLAAPPLGLHRAA